MSQNTSVIKLIFGGKHEAGIIFVTGFSWMISLGVSASAEGTAPVAENLELTTYRNVSVGGQFSAYDPDGNVADSEERRVYQHVHDGGG